ncbi:LemA family protein [Photobacterium leiognathi]|uniref:LemA family protein n=1 Tax=Photobacterium leiognathi TaxID=553611 RepID=UPI00273985DB|nr:LemA family protein [Photobacterium leiognathi]
MFKFPKILKWVFSLALLLQLTGCGINTIPTLDEQVNADWAQVENNYQRRADLIPNLVATVKGYASHEKDTLTAVTEARSKVSSMQVTPETLNNPEAFKKFEAAQGELSSALSRLMVVSERYPDLKANEQFVALQAQLEGTENRIAVARRDYINSVKAFNTEIRTFPGRIWHWIMYSDLKAKPNFSATTPHADVAPKVAF